MSCGTGFTSPHATPTLAGGSLADVTGAFNVPTAVNASRIAGRYELEQILGTGGSGVVYRARDLELNEEVALKVLPPIKPGSGDAERLKREIITARRITHPNVIRIHEFGVSEREGYISMEILPGGTLAERLDRQPLLALDEALRVSVGVCDGIAAAHEQQIIHRDIKPQNVLFDRHGRPKIADFGLARLSDTTTNTVGFSGTPQYMSPEMADGAELTTRSDIYSLGVMLYEIFAGQRPFLATTLARLVMLHTTGVPRPPRELQPQIPPEIESVILTALEKDPARRTQSVADIAGVIRGVQSRLFPDDAASLTRASSDSVRVAPLPAAGEPFTLRGTLLRPSRAPYWFAAAIATLAAAVAGVAWIGPSLRVEPAPTPTPIAIATVATPVAVPSPEKTPVAIATKAAPTAKPAVTRVTPRPAATKLAIAPTPAATPPPRTGAKGRVLVKSVGTWVRVSMGKIEIDANTPMSVPYELPAGTSRITVSNTSLHFSKDVDVPIAAGKTTTVVVDPSAGTVKIER